MAPGSPRRHEGVERRASFDALRLLAMTAKSFAVD